MVQVTEARYEQLLAAEAERDRLAAALPGLGRAIVRQSARQDQLAAAVSELQAATPGGPAGVVRRVLGQIEAAAGELYYRRDEFDGAARQAGAVTQCVDQDDAMHEWVRLASEVVCRHLGV